MNIIHAWFFSAVDQLLHILCHWFLHVRIKSCDLWSLRIKTWHSSSPHYDLHHLTRDTETLIQPFWHSQMLTWSILTSTSPPQHTAAACSANQASDSDLRGERGAPLCGWLGSGVRRRRLARHLKREMRCYSGVFSVNRHHSRHYCCCRKKTGPERRSICYLKKKLLNLRE